MKRLSTFFYAPCLQKVRSGKEGVNNVVGEKGAARLLVFDHKHFLHVFFCASLDPLDLLHLKLSSQRVWMKKGGDFDHPFPLNNNSWQLLSDFQILFFKKRFDLLGIFFHLASLCPRYLLLHVDFLSRGKTTFWHWDNMTF